MPIEKNSLANNSRREFIIKGTLATAGIFLAGKSVLSNTFSESSGPNSKFMVFR